MVVLSSPLELLEPWEHVPLWETFSPLELTNRDVGGNAPLWDGARKVGEGRVVVVSQAGVGWLRVEKFGQLLERLHLLVPIMGISGRWCQVLESID